VTEVDVDGKLSGAGETDWDGDGGTKGGRVEEE